MGRFRIIALILMSTSWLLVTAQQTQPPPPQPSDKRQSTDSDQDTYPGMNSPNSMPRTDSGRSGEESSSRDRTVDLTPPEDDSTHPGSELGGPAPADGITEMKPWNPHQADKDVEVGLYYFKEKNYKAAESRFREALYWQDNHAEAMYRLAVTLDKAGRKPEAREFYEAYLKTLPTGEFVKDAKKALVRLGPGNEGGKKSDKKASISRPSGTTP